MKAVMREEFSRPLKAEQSRESTDALLRELVAHLRQNRTQLRGEWARRIREGVRA